MFSSGFMFFICLNSCVEAVWVGSFALLSDCVPHRPSATLCWCHTEGLHTSNTKVWSFFLFLVIYIRACILCWFSVFRMFTCSSHSLQFSCSPSFIYRHLYYLVTWRFFPPSFALRVSGIVRALCKFTTSVQPVSTPLLHITMATSCCITPNCKVSPVRLRGNHVSLSPFPFFPAVCCVPPSLLLSLLWLSWSFFTSV